MFQKDLSAKSLKNHKPTGLYQKETLLTHKIDSGAIQDLISETRRWKPNDYET